MIEGNVKRDTAYKVDENMSSVVVQLRRKMSLECIQLNTET